jgi:hypothetical protein
VSVCSSLCCVLFLFLILFLYLHFNTHMWYKISSKCRVFCDRNFNSCNQLEGSFIPQRSSLRVELEFPVFTVIIIIHLFTPTPSRRHLDLVPGQRELSIGIRARPLPCGLSRPEMTMLSQEVTVELLNSDGSNYASWSFHLLLGTCS